MDEVTQQNAALVEQAAAAAQSLEEQATRLKDAVSVFKVADTEQPASHMAIQQNKRLSAARIPARRPAESTKPKVASATMVDTKSTALVADAVRTDWQTF